MGANEKKANKKTNTEWRNQLRRKTCELIYTLVSVIIGPKHKGVKQKPMSASMLETAAGHWPFSDQFQHLANQNPFRLAKFAVHFQ